MRARVNLLVVAVVAVVAVFVAGCGGGPGSADSPSGVVRQAVDLVGSKQLDKLTDLACAAQRDTIRQQFDFATGGLGGLGAIVPGIDTSAVLDAVTLDTGGVTVTEASVQGDRATVRLGGKIGVTFDAERMKPVLKSVLQAQGMPADDAAIALIVGQLAALAQNVPVDQLLNVVRENGAWRLCGSATG